VSQKDRKSNPINDIILMLCGFLLLLIVPGMVALAATALPSTATVRFQVRNGAVTTAQPSRKQ
jgi:hypothetical protein